MSQRFKRHPELRLTDVEGDGVVLHLATRRYFSVSESGLVILRALESPQSVADLVRRLMEHYEVTAAQAEASVHEFLDTCRAAELLDPEDAR